MALDLVADHDDLRRMMREFAHLMTMDPPDRDDIMRRRIAFSRMFREHMSREDSAATPLRRQNVNPAQAAAVEHAVLLRTLFLRYSDHIKQWTPGQIERDWGGYRSAVLAQQDSLYELMDWEEANLFCHLSGRTRYAA